jgi:hypothetical protein
MIYDKTVKADEKKCVLRQKATSSTIITTNKLVLPVFYFLGSLQEFSII